MTIDRLVKSWPLILSCATHTFSLHLVDPPIQLIRMLSSVARSYRYVMYINYIKNANIVFDVILTVHRL